MQTEQQDVIDPLALTLNELTEIYHEIEEQPTWRGTADKEMDYADGNQLDSDLLKAMQGLGVPPAIEDVIGPALLSVEGMELNMRTDWRVTPNGEPGGQDVADALNFKLNQAERLSKADQACSDAFRPQIGCGLGIVEVKRDSDPFNFPQRCSKVHRNEVHWDMKAKEKDLSDARWLRRTRWIHPDQLKQVFEQHEELIDTCARYGADWMRGPEWQDGGHSTGLQNAWMEGRAWTYHENFWYNPTSKEVNIVEMWYRRWVKVVVLKFKDGRVVEYDESNMSHNLALANGYAKAVKATVTRMRRSFWLGPHCLYDGPTPYSHKFFPYVFFWGFREDNTGIPYGFVRRMKYNQDAINSGISKLRWGMASVRIERTKGAVAMSDDTLRRQVARPDADIILDVSHMARAGAKFEVKRDFELSQQHFQLINDSRSAVERVSNITSGFQGKNSNATSGRQESIQVEQSNQTLMKIMEHFREARTLMGEMLLSMLVEDMGNEEQTVIIEGDAVTAERTVVINKPETDERGYAYLSNDLQRTRLKVILDDVPSTAGFREQQFQSLSEVTKSLPTHIQNAVLPYLIALSDTPFKKDIVEAIRNAAKLPTEEEIEQRIKEAVTQALKDAGNELKVQELALKERKTDSEILYTNAKRVQAGVQSSYSAMQGGVQIAQMPQIAPIADEIMKGAGYQRPNPMGQDPNFPTAQDIPAPYLEGHGGLGGEVLDNMQVQQNTSPMNPPVPQQGASPMQGIETASTADNLG